MKCIWTVSCRPSRFFTNGEANATSSINPILTMRFAVSLKRSADPHSEREWQLMHFSAINFVSGPTPATGAHPEDIELDPVSPVHGQVHFQEP